MNLRLPHPKTKARFLTVGFGLIILFWMSLEDRNTVTVSLLGTGAVILYGGIFVMRYCAERDWRWRSWFPAVIAFSAICGALSPVIVAILMFFKSSWHGHLYPDFPLQMIGAMLTRVPIWALSGTLFGLSLSIILTLYLAPSIDDNPQHTAQ